jgi:hypothetical protein
MAVNTRANRQQDSFRFNEFIARLKAESLRNRDTLPITSLVKMPVRPAGPPGRSADAAGRRSARQSIQGL